METHAAKQDDRIRVYWQTGCTSCLRTKEFLTKNGIAFESRDVLKDPEAFDELASLGLRQVPIVVRGDQWANGQILKDVAKLCGIQLGGDRRLSPEVLHQRVNLILDATARLTLQIPEDRLEEHLPNRPRSYSDLSYHITNIVAAFIEERNGSPLEYEKYYRVPDDDMRHPRALSRYAKVVLTDFNTWFDAYGRSVDWTSRADIYYGEQSLHDFLERTTWHAGQHLRQLVWVLETLGVKPDSPPGAETFAGLPMPERVWDEAAQA